MGAIPSPGAGVSRPRPANSLGLRSPTGVPASLESGSERRAGQRPRRLHVRALAALCVDPCRARVPAASHSWEQRPQLAGALLARGVGRPCGQC